MANKPAALGLPLLLAAAGVLLLLPFLLGSSRFWLACGSFFLSLSGFSLLLLLAWLRPNTPLSRPLRSAGMSLFMAVVLLGLVVWGIATLF